MALVVATDSSSVMKGLAIVTGLTEEELRNPKAQEIKIQNPQPIKKSANDEKPTWNLTSVKTGDDPVLTLCSIEDSSNTTEVKSSEANFIFVDPWSYASLIAGICKLSGKTQSDLHKKGGAPISFENPPRIFHPSERFGEGKLLSVIPGEKFELECEFLNLPEGGRVKKLVGIFSKLSFPDLDITSSDLPAEFRPVVSVETKFTRGLLDNFLHRPIHFPHLLEKAADRREATGTFEGYGIKSSDENPNRLHIMMQYMLGYSRHARSVSASSEDIKVVLLFNPETGTIVHNPEAKNCHYIILKKDGSEELYSPKGQRLLELEKTILEEPLKPNAGMRKELASGVPSREPIRIGGSHDVDDVFASRDGSDYVTLGGDQDINLKAEGSAPVDNSQQTASSPDKTEKDESHSENKDNQPILINGNSPEKFWDNFLSKSKKDTVKELKKKILTHIANLKLNSNHPIPTAKEIHNALNPDGDRVFTTNTYNQLKASLFDERILTSRYGNDFLSSKGLEAISYFAKTEEVKVDEAIDETKGAVAPVAEIVSGTPSVVGSAHDEPAKEIDEEPAQELLEGYQTIKDFFDEVKGATSTQETQDARERILLALKKLIPKEDETFPSLTAIENALGDDSISVPTINNHLTRIRGIFSSKDLIYGGGQRYKWTALGVAVMECLKEEDAQAVAEEVSIPSDISEAAPTTTDPEPEEEAKTVIIKGFNSLEDFFDVVIGKKSSKPNPALEEFRLKALTALADSKPYEGQEVLSNHTIRVRLQSDLTEAQVEENLKPCRSILVNNKLLSERNGHYYWTQLGVDAFASLATKSNEEVPEAPNRDDERLQNETPPSSAEQDGANGGKGTTALSTTSLEEPASNNVGGSENTTASEQAQPAASKFPDTLHKVTVTGGEGILSFKEYAAILSSPENYPTLSILRKLAKMMSDRKAALPKISTFAEKSKVTPDSLKDTYPAVLLELRARGLSRYEGEIPDGNDFLTAEGNAFLDYIAKLHQKTQALEAMNRRLGLRTLLQHPHNLEALRSAIKRPESGGDVTISDHGDYLPNLIKGMIPLEILQPLGTREWKFSDRGALFSSAFERFNGNLELAHQYAAIEIPPSEASVMSSQLVAEEIIEKARDGDQQYIDFLQAVVISPSYLREIATSLLHEELFFVFRTAGYLVSDIDKDKWSKASQGEKDSMVRFAKWTIAPEKVKPIAALLVTRLILIGKLTEFDVNLYQTEI